MEALSLRVRALLLAGHADRVPAAAAAAMHAAPEEAGALHALAARGWVRLGQPAEAMAAAQAAMRLDDGWLARLAFGEATLAAGEPGQARALVEAAWAALGAWALDAPLSVPRVDLGAALVELSLASGDPAAGLALATRLRSALPADAPEHPDLLSAQGACALACGQPAAAQAAVDAALALRPDPSVGRASELDRLGQIARVRGEPALAVACHEQALQRWESLLGDQSAPAAACCHALAQALHRTGDFVGAHETMGRAFALTAACFGPDHVDTWITAFELGRLEVDVGLVEEGLGRMVRAERQVRQRLGDGHPVLRAMKRWL